MTTEAGKRLMSDLGLRGKRRQRLEDYIAAIEAEAVAAERERIRAAVEGLRVDEIIGAPLNYEEGWNDATLRVLRIIEGETP